MINATTWRNLENIMLSKISQAQKDKYLYEAPRIVKFIETESRIELTSRDRVERAYLFNGYRDSA